MAEPAKPLRIISFNNLLPAYQLVANWVQRHGHRLLLVVTTPGPTTRRTEGYQAIVAAAPPDQEVLVTTRMKRTTGIVEALKPDLVISATFPYLMPPELAAVPRFGAINLHPTLLPAYRGPNPLRAIYDGAPVIGATVHRIEPGFDTGAILAQVEHALPEAVTAEAVWGIWRELLPLTLERGARAALDGEPGAPQDHARATYSPEFTPEERRLDWRLSARTLQCRATALNIFGGTARASIGGREAIVQRVSPLAGETTSAEPGAVLGETDHAVRLAVGDGGIVEVAVSSYGDATPPR